jgi:hypothetical protein
VDFALLFERFGSQAGQGFEAKIEQYKNKNARCAKQ